MCNKSPPKLARRDPPYKNRIPPAHEVNLCLELACSHVLCYKLCVFGSILCPDHQEPGYLCPPVTIPSIRLNMRQIEEGDANSTLK